MCIRDSQNGDAVSYIDIEESCASISGVTSEEGFAAREWDTIDALYRRFQRFGRLIYPVVRRRSGFRLLPSTVYDRSFLNLSLMKKEQRTDD